MRKLVLKAIYAKCLDAMGILDRNIEKQKLTMENNFIRAVNYHEIETKDKDQFEKQIKWLSARFENINRKSFDAFLRGDLYLKNRPGIMITFDDGFIGNYVNALNILEKYNMTGYFFVSAGLIGEKGYMNELEICDMVKNGHEIGCHTFSHHRMDETDSDILLNHEIVESKNILSTMLKYDIDIFCWCGGEEKTYTINAARKIVEAGYKYSFMTNPSPIKKDVNLLQIPRSNIEAPWSISLLKYQISTMNDKRFASKKMRVDMLTSVDMLDD